jgi:hypothetical protein
MSSEYKGFPTLEGIFPSWQPEGPMTGKLKYFSQNLRQEREYQIQKRKFIQPQT